MQYDMQEDVSHFGAKASRQMPRTVRPGQTILRLHPDVREAVERLAQPEESLAAVVRRLLIDALQRKRPLPSLEPLPPRPRGAITVLIPPELAHRARALWGDSLTHAVSALALDMDPFSTVEKRQTHLAEAFAEADLPAIADDALALRMLASRVSKRQEVPTAIARARARLPVHPQHRAGWLLLAWLQLEADAALAQRLAETDHAIPDDLAAWVLDLLRDDLTPPAAVLDRPVAMRRLLHLARRVRPLAKHLSALYQRGYLVLPPEPDGTPNVLVPPDIITVEAYEQHLLRRLTWAWPVTDTDIDLIPLGLVPLAMPGGILRGGREGQLKQWLLRVMSGLMWINSAAATPPEFKALLRPIIEAVRPAALAMAKVYDDSVRNDAILQGVGPEHATAFRAWLAKHGELERGLTVVAGREGVDAAARMLRDLRPPYTETTAEFLHRRLGLSTQDQKSKAKLRRKA